MHGEIHKSLQLHYVVHVVIPLLEIEPPLPDVSQAQSDRLRNLLQPGFLQILYHGVGLVILLQFEFREGHGFSVIRHEQAHTRYANTLHDYALHSLIHLRQNVQNYPVEVIAGLLQLAPD